MRKTVRIESLKGFGSLELLTKLNEAHLSVPNTMENLEVLNDVMLTAADYGAAVDARMRKDGTRFVIIRTA